MSVTTCSSLQQLSTSIQQDYEKIKKHVPNCDNHQQKCCHFVNYSLKTKELNNNINEIMINMILEWDKLADTKPLKAIFTTSKKSNILDEVIVKSIIARSDLRKLSINGFPGYNALSHNID